MKVYIASPYTLGDTARNVKAQIDTFIALMDNGYMPFAPLLTHFVHMAHPKPYDYWTAYDDEWLKACDVLLRLPGESPGADREEGIANSLGIPVVKSLPELLKKWPVDKKKAPLPLGSRIICSSLSFSTISRMYLEYLKSCPQTIFLFFLKGLDNLRKMCEYSIMRLEASTGAGKHRGAGERKMEIRDKKLARWIERLEAHRRTALSGRIDESYWQQDVAKKVQKRLHLTEEIDEIMIDEDGETVLINLK